MLKGAVQSVRKSDRRSSTFPSCGLHRQLDEADTDKYSSSDHRNTQPRVGINARPLGGPSQNPWAVRRIEHHGF